MPAGDNPHSISEKKAALRESPKQQPKNDVNEQPRTSPFPKDKAAAVVGIKRPQPNHLLTPTSHHALGNPGANGHLVYVRRRLETDRGTSAGAENVNSIRLKKTVAGGSQSQEQCLKHQENAVPHTQSAAAAASPALPSASLPAYRYFGKQSPRKVAVQPNNVVIASPPPRNVVSTTPVPQIFVAANPTPCSAEATSAASRDAIATTTLVPKATDPQRSSNQDWKERFFRLRAFLRNNEQSGQEEYVRMLRSLSSIGRTRHAIELEKRAANLLIEEGKELQKMQVLNVLGKLSPTDPPRFTAQHPSVMHLPFQAHR